MKMAPSAADYSNSVFGVGESFCVHNDEDNAAMIIPDFCERSDGLTLNSPRLVPRWRSSSGLVMRQWRHNSCLLLLFLPLLLFSFVDVTYCAGNLPPVFWNTSNSIFDQSNEHSHVIDVHLGDTLDIFCPHYSNKTTIPESEWEYYIIYMVDKENYNKCIINKPHQKVLIINCSRPEDINKFTLLIFEYQPIPRIPDFVLGKDYFITSTSRGSKFSMNNQYKGACDENHMKIMLRVRPPGNGNNYNHNNNHNNNNNNKNNNNNNQYNNNDNQNENNNNNNNNNGGVDTGTTKPVGPSVTSRRTTAHRRTTASTTTTTTTTTYHPRHITDKPAGGDGGNDGSNNGVDDNGVPGTDGFPDDNTLIDANGGPELDKGVIKIQDDKDDNSSSTSVISSFVNILSLTSLVILLTRWTLRVER